MSNVYHKVQNSEAIYLLVITNNTYTGRSTKLYGFLKNILKKIKKNELVVLLGCIS